MSADRGGPILLYDGDCGLCDATVRFVLRHDPGGTLRFAALDSEFGRRVRGEHTELDGVDSMVWYEPAAGERATKVRVRSAAAMEILAYLGGWWRLALVIGVVPAVLRDIVYRWVARHRHHLSRGRPTCVIPAGTEGRFIG